MVASVDDDPWSGSARGRAVLGIEDQADAGGVGGCPPEAGTSLLELTTKLVTPPERPGWWLSLYPEAREAGGQFRSSRSLVRGGGGWDGEDDRDAEELAERSRIEAGRRARGKVRRYCAANGLNRLGTLTYGGGGCHDPRVIRADLGRFFRRLRTVLALDRLAYLWVPEWHRSGHGLHAHFAVGRFVSRGLIEEAWGHGFVHIKLLNHLPVGSGTVGEARLAARYLAKYVSKDPAAGSGLHRYEVAQGFQPEVVKVWGATADDAIRSASKLMGTAPEYTWSSGMETGWSAPPAVWVSWAG